jgi:hypothetical protein
VALVPASGPAGAADGDPASHAELADSLSLAFLVLLESRSPEQRAAFLLREVFDHPHDQIAAIVATSQQHARQLVARARRQVEQRRARFEPSREQRERLARRFFAAAQDGDLGALEELLAHDVTCTAAAGPSRSRAGCGWPARCWRGAGRHDPLRRPLAARGHGERATRGRVLDPSERLIGVLAVDLAEGCQTQTVTWVITPDKLRHLARWPTSARSAAAAAAAAQREGQQPASVSTTPAGWTDAGEPQVDAVLTGGQAQLDQAVARPADGHRGVVHRGRPAGGRRSLRRPRPGGLGPRRSSGGCRSAAPGSPAPAWRPAMAARCSGRSGRALLGTTPR